MLHELADRSRDHASGIRQRDDTADVSVAGWQEGATEHEEVVEDSGSDSLTRDDNETPDDFEELGFRSEHNPSPVHRAPTDAASGTGAHGLTKSAAVDSVDSLEGLLDSWRTEAQLLEKRYCLPSHARIATTRADDLEGLIHEIATFRVDRRRAARISGFSVSTLDRMIRDGRLRNRGEKYAPNLRLLDLPMKPCHLRRGLARAAPPESESPVRGLDLLRDLLDSWEREAKQLDRHEILDRAHLIRVHADELENQVKKLVTRDVNLTEASDICGYSVARLSTLASDGDGRLTNRGERNAPKVWVLDLPFKPGHLRAGLVLAAALIGAQVEGGVT